MMRKYHVRFGGGLTEKDPQGHLAGSLPYLKAGTALTPLSWTSNEAGRERPAGAARTHDARPAKSHQDR
jgi:hypothetical protein